MNNIQSVGTIALKNQPVPEVETKQTNVRKINFKAENDKFVRQGQPRYTQPAILQQPQQDPLVKMLEKQQKEEKKKNFWNKAAVITSIGAGIAIIAGFLLTMRRGGAGAKNEIGLMAEKDFMTMFKDVKNELSFSDMQLTPELTAKLNQIKDKIARTDVYKSLNLPDSVKAMLFYGPPGTGKNTFTYAVTKFFKNAKLFDFDVARMTSAYHGVTEQNIRNATNFILKQSDEALAKGSKEKFIVFCDEIDRVMLQDSSNSAKLSNDVLTQFKKCFNDLKSRENIVIIGATNKEISLELARKEGTGVLDEAMLNRFGDKIRVERPIPEALENAIVKRFAGSKADNIVKTKNPHLRKFCEIISGDEHRFSYRTLNDNIYEKITPSASGELTMNELVQAALDSKDSIFLTSADIKALEALRNAKL